MQAPGYFQLIRRQGAIRLVRQTSATPQFKAQRLNDPLLDQIEVALGDADALEPGKNKDPNPVISEDRRKIRLIEVDQAPFEWFRRVVEDSLPLGLPPIQVNLFVDALRSAPRGLPLTSRTAARLSMRKKWPRTKARGPLAL